MWLTLWVRLWVCGTIHVGRAVVGVVKEGCLRRVCSVARAEWGNDMRGKAGEGPKLYTLSEEVAVSVAFCLQAMSAARYILVTH